MLILIGSFMLGNVKMSLPKQNYHQHNDPFRILNLQPFSLFSGVYELRMYDILLGKKDQFEHRFIQGLPDRCKVSEPAGIWFTEFGPVNTGTVQLLTTGKQTITFLNVKLWTNHSRKNVTLLMLYPLSHGSFKGG